MLPPILPSPMKPICISVYLRRKLIARREVVA
jgi:hypothetical protein